VEDNYILMGEEPRFALKRRWHFKPGLEFREVSTSGKWVEGFGA